MILLSAIVLLHRGAGQPTAQARADLGHIAGTHAGSGVRASHPTAGTVRPTATSAPAWQPWLVPVSGQGYLAPGSKPGSLPDSVLIIDKFNNRLIVVDPAGRIRWQFPKAGDLGPQQTFMVPDDAFFSPDGRQIIATQEDQQVITLIDIATHRIVWRYGIPGQPGSGPNQLSNPDDALILSDGSVVSADIRNCRIVVLSQQSLRPVQIIGRTTTFCLHAPPERWGSPNGAFPMNNGHYLVTEINGDWVDELSLSGRVTWSAHPPDVNYPSDTNEIGSNRYLTVDYSTPGQAIIFDRSGRTIWRFRPTGDQALDHPSLGLPLRNGNILINDDFNHRVIVVDPRTDQIVWQYGHRGVAGIAPGYLNNPDGVDVVPPDSLLVIHAATLGLPAIRSAR